MSDTVKVIIEIPKKVFEARKLGEISPWVTVPILDAVQNGTLENKGEWIQENPMYTDAHCSNCGEVVYTGFYLEDAPKFCPNCGADMRGSKE